MKKITSTLLVCSLLSAFSAQAAVLDISGTITSTSMSVPNDGTVAGTFDDVSKILDITVSFFSSTTLNNATTGAPIDMTTDPSDAVAITIGDPTMAGSILLTNATFSLVSFAENGFVPNGGSPFPFTGAPHVVEGSFALTPVEETALTAGNIFTRVDGDDADGITALSATAVPEPSTALLSFAGLALLARRRRA